MSKVYCQFATDDLNTVNNKHESNTPRIPILKFEPHSFTKKNLKYTIIAFTEVFKPFREGVALHRIGHNVSSLFSDGAFLYNIIGNRRSLRVFISSLE